MTESVSRVEFPATNYYRYMNVLRFLMLLALAVWIGALIFFPFVATTSFTVLPSPHLAGLVVRDSLRKLHWLGFISGVAFIIASVAVSRLTTGRARPFCLSHLLVAGMLALIAISQFRIIPGMEQLRIEAGEISTFPANDFVRAQFDSLHAWSTRIEGTVLVLGLIALYSTARRLPPARV